MLEQLTTERRNPNTMELDEWSTRAIIEKMNQEDLCTIQAVKEQLPAIEAVIEQAIQCMKQNGRIIYVGAGTSGRIGMLDAVECPPTFGMDPNRVIGVLAGEDTAMFAKEEAEDHYEYGQEKMKQLHITKQDLVIGLAASGRTPYVIGALDYAKAQQATTASIACNKHAELSKHADYVIELDNGPEIVTGSTRLKAGTSQKMVCNMITTATMIRLGKVYENLMVDVDVSNEKLYARWLNIVKTATGCDEQVAKVMYEKSKHNAKIAICMILLDYDYEQAEQALKKANGFVKEVIKKKEV